MAGGPDAERKIIDASSRASRGDRPVGRGFLAGYVIAQVGAFLSFLPLLQILLPLKAEQVAGGGRVQLLGSVAALGALAGGLSNLVAGHFSDRSRSRFGRRRPWLLAGCAATVVSYGLIWQAHGAVALAVSVVLFQVAFNVMFAPPRMPAMASSYLPFGSSIP